MTDVLPEDHDMVEALAPSASSKAVVRLAGLVVPFMAVLEALAVGAIMLLALGANPLRGYAALVDGAFGDWNALADTALKSMPLLLVGVGICIAFRAGGGTRRRTGGRTGGRTGRRRAVPDRPRRTVGDQRPGVHPEHVRQPRAGR